MQMATCESSMRVRNEFQGTPAICFLGPTHWFPVPQSLFRWTAAIYLLKPRHLLPWGRTFDFVGNSH